MGQCFENMFRQKIGCYTLVLLFLFAGNRLVHAQNQGAQTFFGKNKIQYHDFEWSSLKGPNFEVFYHVGGRELGVYTATIAEETIRQVEDFLNYKADGRYQILIYNNIHDLNQTNLGFDLESYNTGGLTRLTGNKVLVHFGDSREEFVRELRLGIAKVLIFDMIYGGNIGERLQSAATIYLPDWYLNGLFNYIRDDWNTHSDNELRELINSGRYKKFNQLLLKNGDLAGQAFWYYIAETYGRNAIPNIIYLTRVNRDFKAGLRYVTGKKLKPLTKEWWTFYQTRYSGDDLDKVTPTDTLFLRKFKRNAEITQLKPSPNGKKMAYVEHRKGIHRMYAHDFDTGKRKRIHKSGVKWQLLANKNQYPVLAWHPNGQSIAFFYDIKGRVHFGTIRFPEKGKPELNTYPLFRFDQIYSIDYSPDGQHLAVSAGRSGQSDLYLYHIPSKRIIPLTFDPFDDYEPRFLGRPDQIAFASNRPIDTLMQNIGDSLQGLATTDIFVHHNTEEKKNRVQRITNTPDVNERQPIWLNKQYFAFLSDESGVVNRRIGYLDSIPEYILRDTSINITDSLGTRTLVKTDTLVSYRDTAYSQLVSNYARNIERHNAHPRTGQLYESFDKVEKRPLIYKNRYNLNDWTTLNASATATSLRKQPKIQAPFTGNTSTSATPTGDVFGMLDNLAYRKKRDSTNTPDSSRYTFQSPYRFPLLDETEEEAGERKYVEIEAFRRAATPRNKDPYRLAQTRLYTTDMSIDYVVSQAGNTLFENNMPSLVISSLNSLNQNMGVVLKAGLTDVFEDNKLSGGMLINSDLSNNQYYLMFEYLRNRWDQRYILVQQRSRRQEVNNVFRNTALEGIASFNYPINRYQSVRLAGIYRRDQEELLGTDQQQLRADPVVENWAGIKTEFVQDNTTELALNTLRGTRWKFYVEAYKFLNVPKDYMTVIGLDFRTYLPIYKNMIWANRVAANASLGNRKVLYVLGGVDNWIRPQTDNQLAPPAGENFAFRGVGTNLRGFFQNARNGSNYVLINSELRVPVVTLISRSPISSDFLRSLTVVGFTDIGTAWSGTSPFRSDNPFNVTEFENGPVRVTVVTNKNPVVMGYGFGFRARLFGYFIRADRGWGLDDGQILRPVWYFSLSLDF